MAALNRRAFVAATAAGVAAPTVIGAKEVPKAGMDWMTMSLEARNLAYNNVAHVGPDFARTENRKLDRSFEGSPREAPASTSIWLMLPESGRSGISIPPPTPKRRASFTFMAVIGSAAARRYLPASPKVLWRAAGRLHCPAIRSPRGEPDADHERAANSVRLARRKGRRAWDCGAHHRHGLVGRRASHGIHIGSSKGGGGGGDFGSFRPRCASRFPSCQRQGQIDRRSRSKRSLRCGGRASTSRLPSRMARASCRR